MSPYETDPARGVAAVTTSDSADLTGGICRSLYVGGTGNIKLTAADGTTATLNSVAVGILPVKAKRVWATGTTATNIVALY